MTSKKKELTLTAAQVATLRGLLRKEAAEIGYGTQFNSMNRASWPSRLKNLESIFKILE